jgi:lipid II:glycine glycyltransferase (peptidoglycan interpeptide bridge formation enzyme)
LIHSFGENLTIRVAFKDQQPVASMLTLLHRKTLTYKYGCSDARFHNLGGMPFLFWRVIQEAKKKGAEELDFGRSETDNPGLIAFKDHWGGIRAELKYYRYSLRPSGKSARPWRLDATRRAFSLLPDVCLKTAGTILYKHIG